MSSKPILIKVTVTTEMLVTIDSNYVDVRTPHITETIMDSSNLPTLKSIAMDGLRELISRNDPEEFVMYFSRIRTLHQVPEEFDNDDIPYSLDNKSDLNVLEILAKNKIS